MKQREIKFRGWLKKKEVMTSPFSLPEILYEGDGFNTYTLEQMIPLQFTGLKDKSGKEIYEGDIVRIEHPFKGRSWTGEIVWREYEFTGEGFYFTHFDTPLSLFSEGTEYIRVIGNIYENPGLLET
jgi:uncharacterized phage protein (TIGR01671 family)